MTPLPAAVLPPTDEAAQPPRTGGRRSTTARLLRLELRGARAVVLLTLVALLCGFLVLDSYLLWPGRWLYLTVHLRASATPLVLPMVAAVAVWRGQRVHRCGTAELMASTPRPRSHPLVLDWLTATLPAVAGVLTAWCVAALAPSVTAEPGRLRAPGWLGGHWELILLALVAGMAAVAAVGLVVGRAVSNRFAAPVVAVVVFVAVSMAGNVQAGMAWLTPALATPRQVSDTLPAQASLLQVGFLACVTVATLAAAHLAGRSGTSRRTAVTALAPALVVAAACAVPLVSGTARVVTDEAALRPACTRDAPVVCVHQANSFLLGDVAAQLRPLLTVVAAAGGPTTVELEAPSPVEGDLLPADDQAPDEPTLDRRPVVSLDLESGYHGRLTGHAEAYWAEEHGFAAALTDSERCRSRGGAARADADADADWSRAHGIAFDLLLGEVGPDPRTGLVDPERAAPSAEGRRWLARYFRARSTCDDRAVAALVKVP